MSHVMVHCFTLSFYSHMPTEFQAFCFKCFVFSRTLQQFHAELSMMWHVRFITVSFVVAQFARHIKIAILNIAKCAICLLLRSSVLVALQLNVWWWLWAGCTTDVTMLCQLNVLFRERLQRNLMELSYHMS